VLDKNRQTIQSMFGKIAWRYDRANRLLSGRFDVAWRRRVAGRLLAAPGHVLDLATGTGDLAVDLNRIGEHRVTAADFTFEMLAAGRSKLDRPPAIRPVCADGLALPFPSSAFDGATIAFGIRNFSSALDGLREMTRVVRSGGRVGVLEFSRPRGPFGVLYRLYSKRILPLIGGLVTGHREPYEYLPASVQQFPEGTAFLRLMSEAGLTDCSAERLTGGIVTFYTGRKP
jgi:demethylmenaquinone methyltransferase/2-methoxy-6-polyprenyl-1,4-benzoquinol methylase